MRNQQVADGWSFYFAGHELAIESVINHTIEGNAAVFEAVCFSDLSMSLSIPGNTGTFEIYYNDVLVHSIEYAALTKVVRDYSMRLAKEIITIKYNLVDEF